MNGLASTSTPPQIAEKPMSALESELQRLDVLIGTLNAKCEILESRVKHFMLPNPKPTLAKDQEKRISSNIANYLNEKNNQLGMILSQLNYILDSIDQ